MTALGHTIRVAAVLTALTTMALGPGLAHAETAPPGATSPSSRSTV